MPSFWQVFFKLSIVGEFPLFSKDRYAAARHGLGARSSNRGLTVFRRIDMPETKVPKVPPLEDGLLRAMQALDKQVAREMQRTPAERELKGVLKDEPYDKRVENVSSFLLNSLGEEAVTLDSLLILSRSLIKTLYLVVEDLGLEGLGDVRSGYCRTALDSIAQDAHRGLTVLRGGGDIN
jgi:hypothetical protein